VYTRFAVTNAAEAEDCGEEELYRGGDEEYAKVKWLWRERALLYILSALRNDSKIEGPE
jgi:hypothetical protein